MPRKTKEQKENEIKNETTIKTTKSKKESTRAPKKVAKKDEITATTKKSKTSAVKKVSTSSRKTTAKKSSAKKTTTSKASTSRSKKVKETIQVVEYYDLPYRYNQTIVKVLAQTPTSLFIYWDISDEDRQHYKLEYGENFFETTRPVLIVHNDTLQYSFEVAINDFANSWYLHVQDSKCDYRIELGRKPIQKMEKKNTDYIYISMSNKIESPNDKILFNPEQKMVYFRDVKTGQQTEKPITTVSFVRNMGKFYHIDEVYKAIYQDKYIEDIYDLSNPSSGSFSSKLK